MDIQLAGYSLHRQDRTAHEGVRSVHICKQQLVHEVSRFCRPHYLPREFSAILFMAVYLPAQTDAGTKTALSQHPTMLKSLSFT